MMRGVTRSPTRAGARAALNQVSQGDAMTTPSSVASFRQSKFWAAPVRYSPEELTEPWNWAWTRKDPTLFADAVPGSTPQWFFKP